MLAKLYRSTLGKKAVMAASGILLAGFVLGHMLGNLKLYQGPEKFNAYAEGLREFGAPFFGHGQFLWLVRLLLLAAVALHVHSAWALTLVNRSARPVPYARRDVVQASYAARTMRWGGVILLLFVVYHLAHFTWGFAWAHPDFVPGDVHHNVVAGFRVWWVASLYLLAQAALYFHLDHGAWSLFQSLGWSGPVCDRWRRPLARGLALVVTLGNVSVPLAVLGGLVQ
jgi:succinate dehydrogenase / fumarate reductase cytochrome b subunit